MSQLKIQLTEDMKNAMRAHESVRLGVIRFLLSEIKNFEIDNGEQDDAGIQKIIAREIKKVKDANIDFEKGGRQDLVDQETEKIGMMELYLPKQLSDEELQKVVDEVVATIEKKDFGNVMKTVVGKVNGLADGNRISVMVKQALS
ncbi:GatB/YqeY domain-containing protein [soil metagenome]